jgi:hypothetical protein
VSRRWPAAMLAVMLLAAAPARAQTGGGSATLFGGAPGATVLSTTSIQATATGELAVSFHGDAASGCAAAGLCDYSGTVIVHPDAANIEVLKYRRGHAVGYEGSMFLDLAFGHGATLARVERAAPGGSPGVCVDGGQQPGAIALTIRRGLVTLAPLQPGGTLVATRCAGPLDGDLAAAGPSVTVPLGSLLRGRSRVSLNGAHTFAAHGLAGTVSSTIVLRLQRPQTGSGSGLPQGLKTERVRTVTEHLSLQRAAGTLMALLRGTTDPTECALLDSCSLQGTLTVSPSPHGVDASLSATGPANRPYRDFLAALGLSRVGNPRGIQTFGAINWSDTGAVVTRLTQPGACADSAPLVGGFVVLQLQGGTALASYSPLTSPRTRCPGPMIGPSQTIASGRFPRRDFARRVFTITLNATPSLADDGYSGALRGHLALTLRRGRLSERFFTQPAGA